MTRFGPPIAGGATRFQPVYVDDVAKAAVAGLTGSAAPGTHELGGPRQELCRSDGADARCDPPPPHRCVSAEFCRAHHGLWV